MVILVLNKNMEKSDHYFIVLFVDISLISAQCEQSIVCLNGGVCVFVSNEQATSNSLNYTCKCFVTYEGNNCEKCKPLTFY